MELSAIRTRMYTASADESCILLFGDGRLFACLVQLDPDLHSHLGGCWFVEAVFGSSSTARRRVFHNLDKAIESVTEDAFGQSMALTGPPTELPVPGNRAPSPLKLPEIFIYH